ncbi:MAG: dihydropteroate synthase [Myxococcota bacterium]
MTSPEAPETMSDKVQGGGSLRRPGLADLGARTLVMGVLNVTPDSFSDGGRLRTVAEALDRADRLREEGADVIDVGGESTRPGAEPVPLDEELRRVVPVIEGLSKRGFAGVSIDTTKAEVARRALDAGADIVNDISGLAIERELSAAAAGAGAWLVLGHTRGPPKSMQEGLIEYPKGVLSAVTAALAASMEHAVEAGVVRGRIIVDPGFGFGKTLEDNLCLLRDLSHFRRLGVPVMVGTSRKGFLGTLTGRPVEDREFATAATVALAVAGHADMVRVHDVRSMVDVVRVADAVMRLPGAPAM